MGGALREKPLYIAECTGGRPDQYWTLESLQPVDCVLSDWRTVSPCSASCNGGVETHARVTVTEAKNGGALCRNPSIQMPCNTQPCPALSCVMAEWEPWGPCSTECGGGVMKRERAVSVKP